MAANKILLVTLLQFALCVKVMAQNGTQSFHFENADLVPALKEVSESFGLYLSYNPKIFKGESRKISVDLKNKDLNDVLEALLGEQYKFQIINDYVVITPDKTVKNIAPPITPDREILTPKIVYDTIVVEKVMARYDTQRVVLNKTIYDTVTVMQTKLVYDTVWVKQKKNRQDKWKIKPYIAPGIWNRYVENQSYTYKGMAGGVLVSYQLRKLQLLGGIQYGIYADELSFSNSEIVSNTAIDTISTYYIYEDGERVPVYVTDTTTTEQEVTHDIQRLNRIQTVSLLVGIGYTKTFEKWSIGLEAGAEFATVLHSDEQWYNETDQNVITLADYNRPQVNVFLSIPVTINNNGNEGVFLAPYVNYGLNSDFKNLMSGGDRYLYGIRVGIVF